MAHGARELIDNIAVPIETQPFHTVDNCVNRSLCGAFAVRVFDPQHHSAAVTLGVKPIE